MSKNFVMTVVLVVALLSTNTAAWGQASNPTMYPWGMLYGLVDLVWFDGTSERVVEEVGHMTGNHYDPRRTPFPDSHVTRAGRGIFHVAGMYIDSWRGIRDAVPPIDSVAAAAASANRLWDYAYHSWGYTKLFIPTSIDISMNCHGFSTGRGAWMCMLAALRDDYELTFRRDHLVPGAIFVRIDPLGAPGIHIIDGFPRLYDHSSKIDAVHQIAGTHDLSVNVVEKNRVSALYMKSFTMIALCPTDDFTHEFCTMMSAPLPWRPIGFYRKLP